MSIFSELKRRNVFRVAAAYGVKRAADVSAETSGSQAGKPIDWLILAGIAAVIVVMVADRVWAPAAPERGEAPGAMSEPAPQPGPVPPAQRKAEEGVFIAVLPFAAGVERPGSPDSAGTRQ